MKTKLSRLLAGVSSVLVLFSAATIAAPDAMAGDKHKRDFRRHDGQEYRHRDLSRSIDRNERDRRAFIAGAAVQQHRNDYRGGPGYGYRDGYGDRYRDRYYDDDRDDNHSNIGGVLVGAAIGAVATGLIMSNTNKDSSTTR